jgi:hypothetical protein
VDKIKAMLTGKRWRQNKKDTTEERLIKKENYIVAIGGF